MYDNYIYDNYIYDNYIDDNYIDDNYIDDNYRPFAEMNCVFVLLFASVSMRSNSVSGRSKHFLVKTGDNKLDSRGIS